jgi:hypothetical protein
MIYDSPQWSIATDTLPRVYGGFVSNTCKVFEEPAYFVRIKVPTAFFSFVSSFLPGCVEQCRDDPKNHIRFYMELDDDADLWVFGFYAPHTKTHYDLWCYRELPGWAI